jgi:hypothetical protein
MGVPDDPERERRALRRQAKAMQDALGLIQDRLARLDNEANQE